MTIGEKIRLKRAELNLSLRKLAEITNLSKSTISEIENNKSKNPTKDTLEKIALALGLSLSELIDNTEAIVDDKSSTENVEPKNITSSFNEPYVRSIARSKPFKKDSPNNKGTNTKEPNSCKANMVSQELINTFTKALSSPIEVQEKIADYINYLLSKED